MKRLKLDYRCRLAFLDGAEADSRRRLGRSLSREELERVIQHYPGDDGRPMGPLTREQFPGGEPPRTL